MTDLAELAALLDDAARNASAVAQLTTTVPDLSVADAYAVQALMVARRRARGERRVGIKMGLTSRAKMQQVNVNEMTWGRLTDAMRVEEGGPLSRGRYVHPRAEPEVAYIMRRRLAGRVSPAEALAAVEAVAPAIEIIDSRYRNFRFALPDVIADNSSSSGFLLGGWHRRGTEVDNLGLALEVNGQTMEVGSTAAILGNPIRALVAAARLVDQAGEALEPGDIVLAGAATAAHPLSVGEAVRAAFQTLGTVSFTVAD